jgi:hypothetical protein
LKLTAFFAHVSINLKRKLPKAISGSIRPRAEVSKASSEFRVKQFNGDGANVFGCNRQSEVKDGGLQTKSTCIAACRQDSNEIPTVTVAPLNC